jgi:hypothetical protein
MTDYKKVWLDPRDCGLVTVEAERKRKEEAEQSAREEPAKTLALVPQSKAEILPPAPNTMALPSEALEPPELNLCEFERQIRVATQMLDLSEPEGWLDRLFDRPDHRIDVKTERARRLAGYISACTDIQEAARGFQDARRQQYIDQVVFLQRAAEEQYKFERAQRQAQRQDAIEDAKAREIVADHEAKIREHGLRGRPSLPPPPPPPAPKLPSLEEVAELRRAEVRRAAEDKLAIEADAQEVAANAAEERVTRAKKRCIAIYQESDILAGEKHARIVAVLDEFGYKYDILPRGVAEFIEQGFEEDENELA